MIHSYLNNFLYFAVLCSFPHNTDFGLNLVDVHNLLIEIKIVVTGDYME